MIQYCSVENQWSMDYEFTIINANLNNVVTWMTKYQLCIWTASSLQANDIIDKIMVSTWLGSQDQSRLDYLFEGRLSEEG